MWVNDEILHCVQDDVIKMFGLGKNKKENVETAEATAPADVSEEQFVVMPAQYLPQSPGSGGGAAKSASTGASVEAGGSKKYVIVGAAVVLLAAGTGAYFLFGEQFFGAQTEQPAAPVVPVRPSTASPVSTSTPETATATSSPAKVLTAEARDKENNLLGTLALNIPALVAAAYGQTIGISVLDKDDLTLPADAETIGGLYSAYPLGVSFSEPVSFTLSVIKLPLNAKVEDFVPAYLKGSSWQTLSDYQTTADGWTLSFNQFPAGPLMLIKPVLVPTSTPTTAATTPETVPASADADADGLTDKEEVLLGTNTQVRDTDGDTYEDKHEIMNNYSPLAGKNEKLSTAALFKLYTNPQYGYQVYFPAKWLSDSLDQTGKQVLFVSNTEEFFEVLIEENTANLPIVDWYRSQSPALASVSLSVTLLSGVPAVWSPDKSTLYAGRDGLVYILTYNRGNLSELNWPTAWEYFYKNFKFGNIASGSTGNATGPGAATSTAGTTNP